MDTDGSMTNVRALRSLPMLDEAAITCARRWRYEPTVVNGSPVSVILTATVNFTLGQ